MILNGRVTRAHTGRSTSSTPHGGTIIPCVRVRVRTEGSRTRFLSCTVAATLTLLLYRSRECGRRRHDEVYNRRARALARTYETTSGGDFSSPGHRCPRVAKASLTARRSLWPAQTIRPDSNPKHGFTFRLPSPLDATAPPVADGIRYCAT